jgi:hypothetical protein
MTPFPQPVELDAVLDTSWEPIADMIKRKAEESDAEMLVVAHHSKKWWEEALAGSVAKVPRRPLRLERRRRALKKENAEEIP